MLAECGDCFMVVKAYISSALISLALTTVRTRQADQ